MVPPVYPTRVRTTPLVTPNRASAPQNHPSANVAVPVLVGVTPVLVNPKVCPKHEGIVLSINPR